MQCAIGKNDSSKILIYLPENREVQIDLNKMKSGEKQYTWLIPMNGNTVKVEAHPENIYTPPQGWEDSIFIIKNI